VRRNSLINGSAYALLFVSFGWLYADVVRTLVRDWATDDNYSHGFLIVPLALFFAWERRAALSTLAPRPSNVGLAVMVGSVAVLMIGFLGAELFLTRVAMVGTAAGMVLFLYGWGHLRLLAFPIGFLLLMIPIPAIILNQVTFPLQLLASRVGESTLMTLEVPVLREGNVILLANTSLEVAEACSGIRSLVSLLTLGIVYGYFGEPRSGIRLALVALTIPIAIAANGLRVAGTGFAAHYYGPAAAQGFFHSFSGWTMFVAAFAMLFASHYLLGRFPSNPLRPRLVPQTRAAEIQ
jgi:exosortase